MTNQNRSFDDDYALIANCMMYGYIPLEFFRETASETPGQEHLELPKAQASPSDTQGFNIAWIPMIFALMLGILGISRVATNPLITDSPAMYTKNTLTEIGMPNR